MSAIRDIFQTYGPEYLALYRERMPKVHKKVLWAIQHCRTGAYGTALYRCEDCGSVHAVGCSCGNRHCPTCQQGKAEQWLAKQQQKRLPCHYFLLTVTLPPALHRVVRSHQRTGYSAMFSCAYGAIRKLTKDVRFLGTSRIGMTAVLHTWGGQLQYHPHLHIIIPGGGLTEDASQWVSSRQDLFVHTKPLAKIFRAKFRDRLDAAGLLDQVDPEVWRQDWVVHSEGVGSGENALRYLARYVSRVAVSKHRILSCEHHSVTFRYKHSHTQKWRTMKLDALEFIRRFLQHVLPTGFMKIRHYGFLNPNAAVSLDTVRDLVCAFYEILRDVLPNVLRPRPPTPRCPRCQGALRLISFCVPDFQTLLPEARTG